MKIHFAIGLVWAAQALAQQTAPQVRVTYLNVCTPDEAEQKEIAAALAHIPRRPAFAPDFEVARGQSAAPDTLIARWVRMRREFVAASPFRTVQYSFSVDDKGAVETAAFLLREPKDLMQVSIEHSAPGDTAAAALAADAHATRIKLERFGKSSVVLARCAGTDQSVYETLFQSASQILSSYRATLDVRRTVPADLARVEAATTPKKAGGAKKKSAH